MKTLKKLFSVSAIVALLGTLFPMHALAANYSDELQEAYAYALSNGITTMKTIDAADMYGSLTRVAMAKMIANYATTVLGLEPDTSAKCTFTDVTAALDAQYDNGVTKACQLGLMGQNITAFRPNDLVTRAEFGTTLSRALNHDSDELADMNAANPYYKDHLNFLKSEGIMNQIDNPGMTEVRGYVMLMMMRADEGYTPNEKCSLEEMVACALADDTDACLAACTGNEEEEEPAGNGYIKVSRVGSSTTQEVAKNAVNKKIGSIKLTAGEYDSTVSSVVISHSGLGDAADVELELYKNGVAITTVKGMSSSSQSATLKIKPAITIKAGKSETIDVYASVDGESNETHNFVVSTVNVSNGKAEGTPITLDTLKTTSYSVPNVAATLVSDTIRAGETNKTIATVTITPQAKSVIKGITIARDAGEDIDTAVSNVKAYYNDQQVGKVTVTDEKIAISDLNIERENGENAVLELRADGIYIGDASSIDLVIEAGDVLVIESSTNENMRLTATAGDTLNLSSVKLTVKDTTKDQTVAPGTSNVELMNTTITSNADLEVSNYKVELVDTSLDFTEFVDDVVTIYIDGDDNEWKIADGTSLTFNSKNDRFSIDAGETVSIRVVGNVKSTANVSATYSFKLTINEVKNVDNNGTITLTTNNTATSHETTIDNGSVTLSKVSSTPTNTTIMEGEDNDVLFFNLKASSENQTLKSVTITDEEGGNFAGISSLTLYAGDDDIATVDRDDEGTDFFGASSAGNTAVFDDFSYTLKKDTTTTFKVVATLDNGEVTDLGADVSLSVATTDIATYRSTDTTVPTTVKGSDVVGKVYQIATATPSAVIKSQNGKNTTIVFKNETSSYDIVITDIKVVMTQNKDNGSFVNRGGTAKLLDSINGTALSTTTPTIPGEAAWSSLTLDSDENTVVVELVDAAHTVTADDYTLEVKSIDFYYVDKDDSSKTSSTITQTYSEIIE